MELETALPIDGPEAHDEPASRRASRPIGGLLREMIEAPSPAFTQTRGVVLAAPDGVLRVRCDHGIVTARVAVSCLVRPAPRDEVLLAHADRGPAYVLAVLERPGDAALELGVDRDLSVRTTGQLSLTGAEGVRVDGGPELVASARAVRVQGEEAKAVFRGVEVFAARLSNRIGELRTVGEKVELIVGTLSERLMNAVRKVEGAQITHAGDIDTRSEGAFHVRARHAEVVAEKLVRLDGEQIHMG